MKDRSVIILLVAILVVGLFIGVQEFKRSKIPRHTYEELMVFDIHPQTLLSLHFSGTNGVIDCVMENREWMVGNSEQGMGRAAPSLVYKLVAEMDSLLKGTTITGNQMELRGLNPAEYGFDSPVMRITVIDHRGRRTWEVGRSTPMGQEVYLREIGSGDVFTIMKKLLEVVPADPDDLRNRVLFPGEIAGVKRIEVRRSSGFLRIVKEGAAWGIQQPITAPGDPYEIAAYLEKLQQVKIEDFIDNDVSDFAAYGLQGETLQISVGGVDGSSNVLILGDPVPGCPGMIYARRADDTSVFAVKDEVFAMLNAPVNTFRDARVLSIAKEDVAAISIRHAGEQVALVRDEAGAWKVNIPAVWNAAARTVDQLIDLWERVVVTEFDVPPSSAAVDWSLTFVSGAGVTNRIDVLERGEKQDGLLVRLNGSSDAFQVNLPIVPNTIINPLAYKSRLVWNQNDTDVRRIVLSRSGKPEQTIARASGGAFAAVESSGNGQVDDAAVERLLSCLHQVVTPGYIEYNPRDLAIYGLSEPALTLHVGLDGTLGQVLLVGNESPDGYYSMIKGRDIVFFLDKETVDVLFADLLKTPDTPEFPVE